MINRVLLAIIRVATCIILLVPLLVTHTTFFPYIFGKMVAFQILVEVSACAWLLLMVRTRQYLPLWRNPVLISLTVFIGSVLLGTFFSASPHASWWSSQERMTGVISLLHLWIWFVMLHSCMRRVGEWRALLTVSLLSSILLGLYGIGQLLGFPFLMPNASGARLASTLGNPIYLGVYSLTHIFIASYLSVNAQRRWWSMLFALSGCFNAIILILAYSRGVFFVLILSLILFIIGAAILFHRVLGRRAAVMMCALVVIAFGITLWARSPGGDQWLQHTPPAFQLMIKKNIIDPDRFQLWNVGLRGFLERPLFGWGNENFNLVYYKYTHPNENGVNLQLAWFDRSHNQVIDVLVLYGLAGIISYAVFWSVLAYSLLRRTLRDSFLRNRLSMFIIGIFFFAYFVQNLSVFDSTVPLILFYFLAAFASFLITDDQVVEFREIEVPGRVPANSYFMTGALSMCIIASTVVVILKINLVPLSKSELGIRAITTAHQGRIRESLELFKQSLADSSFTNQEIRRHLATTTLEAISAVGGVTQPLSALLDFAISELNKSIDEQPLEIRNHLVLSQLYRVKAFSENDSYRIGISTLDKALAFAPYRLDLYYELSAIYTAQGDQTKAKDTLERAERLKNL